jgi:hypothetical protein
VGSNHAGSPTLCATRLLSTSAGGCPGLGLQSWVACYSQLHCTHAFKGSSSLHLYDMLVMPC